MRDTRENNGCFCGGAVMEKNRTWLYCRGDSETDELEAYAQENGMKVVGCSSDVGNEPTLDHPGLLELRAAMEERRVDILLMMNLSCLGQSLDEVGRYWQTFKKHRVRLCTVTEGEIYLDMPELFREMFGK